MSKNSIVGDVAMAVLHLNCLLLIICLSGCANVAVSSAQAVYSRHSIQKNLNDQYLTMRAFKALNIDDDRFKNTNIAISTFNGEILLAGQAPEPWQRIEAEKIVKKIPDVRTTYNLITVANPSSTLKRISDAWITAKVKAKLIASNDIDATQIKVVTENGTVYLMGILPPEDAQTASQLASETAGVEKVVKIFSYLRISKR